MTPETESELRESLRQLKHELGTKHEELRDAWSAWRESQQELATEREGTNRLTREMEWYRSLELSREAPSIGGETAGKLGELWEAHAKLERESSELCETIERLETHVASKEAAFSEVEAIVEQWLTGAGWESNTDSVAEVLREMRNKHCDERSERDLILTNMETRMGEMERELAEECSKTDQVASVAERWKHERDEAQRELAAAREDTQCLQREWVKAHGLPPAPCLFCGYNGPGYYQPSQHPCAARAKEPTT